MEWNKNFINFCLKWTAEAWCWSYKFIWIPFWLIIRFWNDDSQTVYQLTLICHISFGLSQNNWESYIIYLSQLQLNFRKKWWLCRIFDSCVICNCRNNDFSCRVRSNWLPFLWGRWCRGFPRSHKQILGSNPVAAFPERRALRTQHSCFYANSFGRLSRMIGKPWLRVKWGRSLLKDPESCKGILQQML
jgi:hypothetical protein